MNPNLEIAWRFLIAKKRAMIMSLAGIVFGVGFFILTQAQTSGFERFFIQTILGANGSIRIQDTFQQTITSMLVESGESAVELPLREGRSYIPGVHHPKEVIEAVGNFESVIAAAPVLRDNVDIVSGFRTQSARLLGIDPQSYVEVSDLEYQIQFGSLDDFNADDDSLLIGIRLADRLQIRPGDTVLLRYVGKNERFRVAGIFETGIDFFDKNHVFSHLGTTQQFLAQWDKVSYIQVLTENPEDARGLAAQMEYALQHHVASWQERERSWLEVFKVLRFSSALTMSTLLLIAGLGIFNTLAIIVMERSREIAILRSIGYSRSDVRKIFLWQGMIVCFIGTALGWVLAFLLTLGAESLPIRIRGIFSTDHFLVHWSIWHYISATVVAFLVVFLASLIPAQRASRIEPGEIIRNTSG